MFVWIGSIKILFIKLYAIEQIIIIIVIVIIVIVIVVVIVVVVVVKISITVTGRKLNFVSVM